MIELNLPDLGTSARPDSPEQQTLRAQYNGFKDYLCKVLPEDSVDTTLGLEELVQSFKHTWEALESLRPPEDEDPPLLDPSEAEG